MGKYYIYGYVRSQITYWEERMQKEKDPVLVALCIGRLEAYNNVLKEIEETQNIAEYVPATEVMIKSNQKERLEVLEKEGSEEK